jgi:hypothetical protein
MGGVTGRFAGDELTKLWGFKGCRDIKIHIPLNGIVTITAEFNATRDQMEQAKAIIKKYRLEEIPEEKGQK